MVVVVLAVALATAADVPLPPSVAETEAPRLEWIPVLQLRTGAEFWQGWDDDLVQGVAAGRVGVEARRRAVTARVSVGGHAAYPSSAARDVDEREVYLSEAWVNLDPYISEALLVHVTAGVVPVEFHEGRVVGRDDLRLDGRFPVALRLHLGASPLSADGVVGVRPATEGAEDWSPPFWAARLGAGRATAASEWQLDAVAVGGDANPGADADIDHTTAGLYGRARAGRVRAVADAYVQPFLDAGTAVLGGGRLGWAFGGDARVVLGATVEGKSGLGDSPSFSRPWGDAEDGVGPMARYRSRGLPDGALGAGVFADAVVTPGFRVDSALWQYGSGDAEPLGVELDIDARLYFGPLVNLHLRSGLFDDGENPVRADSALTLDVQI